MAKDQEAVRGTIGLGTAESEPSCRLMSARVWLLIVICGVSTFEEEITLQRNPGNDVIRA